jgi:hypothetical protein
LRITSDLKYFDFILKRKFYNQISDRLFREKIVVVVLLYISIIPQIIQVNRIVIKNVLSGDWYLARQLMSISKARISDFDLITDVSFVDPTNLYPLLGNLGYSNGLQILTPNIVFFKFMPENFVSIFHFLFVTSIAIYYILKLVKILQFDNTQTIFFAIVWLNCGPLVARISEGHIQLLGYYLIPGFFYHIHLIRSTGSLYSYLNLGFFLGFIELLGSTHVYLQMCLIGLFISIFNPKKILMSILTLLISILASAIQILPIIFFNIYTGSERSVYEGYGYHFIEKYFDLPVQSNEFEWLREVIAIPFHLFIALVDYETAIALEGWEWTLYIGLIPTLFCFLAVWKFRHDVIKFVSKNLYLIPLFLISLSLIYRLIFLALSNIMQIVAVDRVPYRMMIYVLFLVWLFTCHKFPSLLKGLYRKKYLVFFLIITAYINLLVSTNSWFIRHRVENLNTVKFIQDAPQNMNYLNFVFSCFLITLFTWGTWVFYRINLKYKSKV